MPRFTAASSSRKTFPPRPRRARRPHDRLRQAAAAACEQLEPRTLLSLTLSVSTQSVDEGGSNAPLTVHAQLPYDPENPYALRDLLRRLRRRLGRHQPERQRRRRPRHPVQPRLRRRRHL